MARASDAGRVISPKAVVGKAELGASGITFVCAGVFQGLGNTWPSLAASALRALALIAPLLILSTRPGFAMHTIWLTSLITVFFQLAVQQLFLRRELRLKAPA